MSEAIAQKALRLAARIADLNHTIKSLSLEGVRYDIMFVMPNLDRSLLEAALSGLEAQKVKVEEYISAVRSQLGLRGPGRPRQTETDTESPTPPRKKRRMSAAGRRAIIAATKKRWAAVRAQKEAAAAPASKRRKMSAAAKKTDSGGSEEEVG